MHGFFVVFVILHQISVLLSVSRQMQLGSIVAIFNIVRDYKYNIKYLGQ